MPLDLQTLTPTHSLRRNGWVLRAPDGRDLVDYDPATGAARWSDECAPVILGSETEAAELLADYAAGRSPSHLE